MDDTFLPEIRRQPSYSPARAHSRRVHEALLAWTEIAPGKSREPSAAMGSNGSKPYQAQLIRDHGFNVPETLITNEELMAPWIGSREIAFILAEAPELPPPPTNWEAAARVKLFHDLATGGDFRTYIRTVSYGKARLLGDVYGPYTVVAQRLDGSWDIGNAMDQAISSAVATGLVGGVNYFCVVFTDHPGPSWAFWSAAGGRCYVDMLDPLGVIAMENLHVLTQFGDLYGIADGPGGFDVMDCACGTHPSSFTKLNFGWLDPSEVVNVPAGTPTQSQTLHALSSPISAASTPGRAHAIKAPSASAQRYHLIEARLRTDAYESSTPGVSSGLPAEGLVVYWIDETTWPPVHLKKVLSNVGDQYSDASQGLTVTMDGSVPLGLVARVDRGQPAECTWIRNELANIEAEIAGLQEDLQQAPPGEKPGIAAQIKRLQAQSRTLRERSEQLGCST
jgi:hypothetical protein